MPPAPPPQLLVSVDEPEGASASEMTVAVVGRDDVRDGGSFGGTAASPAASNLVRNQSRARQCCTPPAPPRPSTLPEAMEAACNCSVAGDLEGLKVALQHARTFDGFALNVQGIQGRTPLYKACHGRQPEVVQWLLDQEDYVPDVDGNRDAYKAICATETGHAQSKDPGSRTAFIMRQHGYTSSGKVGTPSPASSPTPKAEPEPEIESKLGSTSCKAGWRRRLLCYVGDSTEYNPLLDESAPEDDATAASPIQYGALSKDSKRLIGQDASFRENDPKKGKTKNATGEKTMSSTQKIIAYLERLDDDEKHELHTAAGPTVSVEVDERKFELTVEMCKFELRESESSEDSLDYRGVDADADALGARDDRINEMMLIYAVTDEEQTSRKLEVGRKHEALCFYKTSGKWSHSYSYQQCNCDVKKIVTCEGSSVTLYLTDGDEINVNAASVNDAEAICYFVQLGFDAWKFSSYGPREVSDGALHQIGSAALQVLDVDKTTVAGCARACSVKKCCKACEWLANRCKGCWNGLWAFFESDVIPDHSTPTCVWFWIFVLQLICHLLFPPLVLWSRTRKADEMPENLVRQRCLVLSVRWIVVVGTLALYARGSLPSMASSEPVVNMLMWLFVAVTHSAREASLDEIPQQFDDTLSAAFNHKSRHVNSSDGNDAKGRLIEHELAQFLRYGRNKQSKFSHRMTERRLHELHQDRLQIDNARFEGFHSTELQSELCSGRYILSLGSKTAHQTRLFDEVVTTLQTIFNEPAWCLKTPLGDEFDGESVVPDSVRKMAAIVRMHVKEIQRKRYSRSSGDTAAYAFEIDQLAAEAVQWDREGAPTSSSSHPRMEKQILRKCLLSRGNALGSHTDDKLCQWDALAKRVADALSQDAHGEKWARYCYTLRMMMVSISLVFLWIWLGTRLGEYVRHYLMLECTDVSCVCWSILTVAASFGLVVVLGHLLQSVFRRFETFRTTTLSDKLLTDVQQFIKDWQAWETQAIIRTRSLSPQGERQVANEATDAEAADDDDEPFAGGIGLFGDDTEEEPEPEPEPEQVTEPKPQPSGHCVGTARLTAAEIATLSLTQLTALSADKLHVGSFDEFTSKTDMWSELLTCDFDRLSLELSRVQSRQQRQEMLEKWKELRVNEMMAPHREMEAQSYWCCCCKKAHTKVNQDDNALVRTATTEEKARKLGGNGGLWEEMVQGRVERERRIIELRAELFSRLEIGLKRTHGVLHAYDAEAPPATPVNSYRRLRRQSNHTFGEGTYETPRLQAYLVAESILALAHMQSKKLYATHLYCIIVVCVLDAVCHPLKDLVSSWLGVPCDEDITYRCVLNETQGLSWPSASVDSVNFCADASYNATSRLPCGERCDVESTVFFSCTPKVYEVLVRIVSSIVGATLVFSIFCDLAEVIRGYRMRYDAVQYFSQLTPNQGSLTHQRKNHYGLLPTFELTTRRNIIVWNRIRVFLMT